MAVMASLQVANGTISIPSLLVRTALFSPVVSLARTTARKDPSFEQRYEKNELKQTRCQRYSVNLYAFFPTVPDFGLDFSSRTHYILFEQL